MTCLSFAFSLISVRQLKDSVTIFSIKSLTCNLFANDLEIEGVENKTKEKQWGNNNDDDDFDDYDDDFET